MNCELPSKDWAAKEKVVGKVPNELMFSLRSLSIIHHHRLISTILVPTHIENTYRRYYETLAFMKIKTNFGEERFEKIIRDTRIKQFQCTK